MRRQTDGLAERLAETAREQLRAGITSYRARSHLGAGEDDQPGTDEVDMNQRIRRLAGFAPPDDAA